MKLIGKAYHLGGTAYHPRTDVQVKVSHFGGFVCSEWCDRRSHIDQEESMPGHAGQRNLDPQTDRKITEKWATR